VGKFAALKIGGRVAVSAEAEAAPVEGPSAHKVEEGPGGFLVMHPSP